MNPLSFFIFFLISNRSSVITTETHGTLSVGWLACGEDNAKTTGFQQNWMGGSVVNGPSKNQFNFGMDADTVKGLKTGIFSISYNFTVRLDGFPHFS